MIQCGRCGKIYDYEKRNGICPACCRYNRKDSAVLEKELHSRYDMPNVHSDQMHKNQHSRNYDKYRHTGQEYSSMHDTYGQPQMGQKKGKSSTNRRTATAQKTRTYEKPASNQTKKTKNQKRASLVWSIIVMLIAIIVPVAGGIVEFLDERQAGSGYEIFEDNPIEELEKIDLPDFLNGLGDSDAYVAYGWSEYLGDSLVDVDWDSHVALTDGDMEDIEAVGEIEDAEYFLLILELDNDSNEDVDLLQVDKSNFQFATEDEEVLPVLKLFHEYYEVLEADDYSYVTCLVAVPEDYYQEHMGEEVALNGTWMLPDDGGISVFEMDLSMYE